MNRPFGWIDFGGVLLWVVVAFFIELSRSKTDARTVDRFGLGLVLWLSFPACVMLWGFTVSMLADHYPSWARLVPDKVESRRPVLNSDNHLVCPEGFSLESGRRNSFFCERKIPHRGGR